MASRGKMVALLSAGLGILVLLAAGVSLWVPTLEEWHIHKLKTGTREERRRALAALRERASVRAVPALLEAPARWRDAPAGTRGTQNDESLIETQMNIALELGSLPNLPFPAETHTGPETTFLHALLDLEGIDEPPGPSQRIRLLDVLEVLELANAAFDTIGDKAVPALERAAEDERLDPVTSAHASFQLVRRTRAHPRLDLRGESAEVSVDQRTAVPLPQSHGSVYLSAGDVTRGQVKVWVTLWTGAPLVEEQPLARGEEVAFSIGGKNYVLRLEDLRNRLIGTDRARFRLREGRE